MLSFFWNSIFQEHRNIVKSSYFNNFFVRDLKMMKSSSLLVKIYRNFMVILVYIDRFFFYYNIFIIRIINLFLITFLSCLLLIISFLLDLTLYFNILVFTIIIHQFFIIFFIIFIIVQLFSMWNELFIFISFLILLLFFLKLALNCG